MGLAETDGHPNEEFAVNLNDALVFVRNLEELQDEFDFGQEELLVLDVPSADQGAEEVQVDCFLSLHVSKL